MIGVKGTNFAFVVPAGWRSSDEAEEAVFHVIKRASRIFSRLKKNTLKEGIMLK